MKTKVSILGATGHIGCNLVYLLEKIQLYELYCYVRDISKIKRFIENNNINNVNICNIDEFGNDKHEIIINCIGIGLGNIKELFSLTEKYDNIIINCLKKENGKKYINFSSGAVYGNKFENPVNKQTISFIEPNNLNINNHTTIIKLNSELKHRLHTNLNIIDLRLFAYFSRFIDFESKYFMAQLANSLIQKKDFVTDTTNFVRDYINPYDLESVISYLIHSNTTNSALDLYSKSPIDKIGILNIAKERFDLKVMFTDKISNVYFSGNKNNYYSEQKIPEINNLLRYTSKETIIQELDVLLGNHI